MTPLAGENVMPTAANRVQLRDCEFSMFHVEESMAAKNVSQS
jgi:hypothetical protein